MLSSTEGKRRFWLPNCVGGAVAKSLSYLCKPFGLAAKIIPGVPSRVVRRT